MKNPDPKATKALDFKTNTRLGANLQLVPELQAAGVEFLAKELLEQETVDGGAVQAALEAEGAGRE